MKKLSFILVGLSIACMLTAQVPGAIKYQSVVRDASGAVIADRIVSFRFTVVEGTITGTAVYVERNDARTNEFGLANLEIGRGTPVSGTFGGIDWSAGSHFLKVELDPNGGTDYQMMGISELLSVPYALHAKTVATGDNWGTQRAVTDATLSGNGTTATPLQLARQGATTGQLLKWNGSTWSPSDDLTGGSTWQLNGTKLYYNNGNVGIGTNNPQTSLHLNSTGVFTGLLLTNNDSGTTFGDGLLIGHQYQGDSPNNRYAVILNQENAPLSFGTNGRYNDLNITAAGNVGIGTYQADARLQVNGQVKITGGSPGLNKVLTSDATGLASWQTPGSAVVPGGLNGQIQFNFGGAFGGDPALFWNNPNKRMGIGTANPDGLLELDANSTTGFPQLLLHETEGDFARLMFRNSAAPTKNWTVAAITDASDDNSRLNFWYWNGTTGTDWISLSGNGKLGIGMTNPPFKVGINGGTQSGEITFHSDLSGLGPNDGLRVGMSASNTNAWVWLNEDGKLYFGTNNLERMTILGNGNVGIGDKTPDATLDVEGTVIFGANGVSFTELRELTGTTGGASSSFVTLAYPSGYTPDNIRVLSLEINYNGNAWIGLSGTDFPSTDIQKVFYYLTSNQIYIYYPNVTAFQGRSFRMLIMKMN